MTETSLTLFCEAISKMSSIAMVAFVGFDLQCDMAPVDALKKLKPRLTISFGVYESIRSHTQLVQFAENIKDIKEMHTLLVQFCKCILSAPVNALTYIFVLCRFDHTRC